MSRLNVRWAVVGLVVSCAPPTVVPRPDAPRGVVATPGDGAVTIAWQPVPEATGYSVYWSTSAGVDVTATRLADATSPATIPSLANRTPHFFVVTATGPGGESARSAEVSATPRAVPGAPGPLTATRGDGAATLTWDAVEDADSYDLYASEVSGATLADRTRILGVSSPFTHHGLRNGTPFHWVLVARNTAGDSAPSPEATATPRGSPEAPVGLAATRGDGRVSVSWTGVGGAESYVVYASSLAGVTRFTGDAHALEATTFEETGLTNGLPRFYVVTAVNEAGEGEASAQLSATPLVPPAAPFGTSATRGNGEITLEWSSDALAVSSTLTWSTTSSVAPGAGTTVLDARSPFTLRGLTNGTAVFVVVQDSNEAGVGEPSVVFGATPLAPPAVPSGLEASRGDGRVTLRWVAVPLADRYDLLYSAGHGLSASPVRVANVTSPSVVEALLNGTPYAFALVAANDAGESTPSPSVEAVPLVAPARVEGLVATRGESRVSVTWPAVALAEAYDLYARPTASAQPGLGTKFADVRSPFVDEPLVNGVSRTYVVVARNEAGSAPPSAEAAATPLARPAAPDAVVASASDGTISLRWAPVADADSYDVYWSASPGVTRLTGTRVENASSPLVQAAPNGAPRFFVVTATNASGEGEASGEAAATPWPTLTAPGGLVATAGPESVTLDWSDVAHADAYALYWTTGSTVSKATATRIGLVSKPFVHAGLVDGTTHRYGVAALHGGGEGPLSATVSATPRSPPPPPAHVTAIPGSQSVRVSWDPVPGATSYRVYVQRLLDGTAVGPARTTTATTELFDGLIDDESATSFFVSAVNEAGEGARSRPACARPSPWQNPGLSLFDGLCGPRLDNQRWQAPQQGRGVIDGRLIMAAVADGMQARRAQGITFQNLANVQSGVDRVTSLQARVRVPSTYASTDGAFLVASVRMGYQPAAHRGFLVPGANTNMLVAAIDLIDLADGTGLHVRRSVVHCDNPECSTFSTTGFVISDPAPFTPGTGVPTQAVAPAAYDTDYTLRLALDEATNTFTWTVQGGAYPAPVSGTVDVRGWLATPGLGMVMNTSTGGFAFAQVGVRIVDDTEAGGRSGSIFALFDDATVGLNGQAPALYDDFATMGSNDQAGPSAAKWGGADTAWFIDRGGLRLRATHVAPVPGFGATFGSLPVMYPATFNTMAYEVELSEDQVTAPFVFRGLNSLGHFFNDGTGSGRVGDATGDVRSQLFISTASAFFSISRCSNPNCTLGTTYSTSPSNVLAASPTNPLVLGSRHRLLHRWDPATHTFTYQLDDQPPVVVDPTNPLDPAMGGAAVAVGRATPGYPSRSFGIRTGVHGGATTGARSNFEILLFNLFTAP